MDRLEIGIFHFIVFCNHHWLNGLRIDQLTHKPFTSWKRYRCMEHPGIADIYCICLQVGHIGLAGIFVCAPGHSVCSLSEDKQKQRHDNLIPLTDEIAQT